MGVGVGGWSRKGSNREALALEFSWVRESITMTLRECAFLVVISFSIFFCYVLSIGFHFRSLPTSRCCRAASKQPDRARQRERASERGRQREKEREGVHTPALPDEAPKLTSMPGRGQRRRRHRRRWRRQRQRVGGCCFLSLAYSFHFTLFRSHARTFTAEQQTYHLSPSQRTK